MQLCKEPAGASKPRTQPRHLCRRQRLGRLHLEECDCLQDAPSRGAVPARRKNCGRTLQTWFPVYADQS